MKNQTHVSRNGKKQSDSWVEICEGWLKKGVLCAEAQRYIQNFLSISQMRADYDPGLKNHEDDIFSEAELDEQDFASIF